MTRASQLLTHLHFGGYISTSGRSLSKEEIDRTFNAFLTDCSRCRTSSKLVVVVHVFLTRFAMCFFVDVNDVVRDFERRSDGKEEEEDVFMYTMRLTFRSENVGSPRDSSTFPSYHAYIVDQGRISSKRT